MRPLTNNQVDLLITLLPRELSPKDAAFQTGHSVSAATKIMNALTVKGLTMYEEPIIGLGCRYSWAITPHGVDWVRNNRARVEEVLTYEGFAAEDIASVYTKLV